MDKRLQKTAGIFGIAEGVIYIIAFIFYGSLNYPNSDSTINQKLNFLIENQLGFLIINFISYILFGIILSVLVLGIYHRLKNNDKILSQITAIFGLIWVVLVIASGMIENIGLNSVIEIGNKNPEKAMMISSTINIITEGIGGGNEIVGGIWVLLLSITSLKGNLFYKPLNYLGVFIGIVGILTTYPLDIFKEIFGVSQIVWFIWIGFYMVLNPLLKNTYKLESI